MGNKLVSYKILAHIIDIVQISAKSLASESDFVRSLSIKSDVTEMIKILILKTRCLSLQSI